MIPTTNYTETRNEGVCEVPTRPIGVVLNDVTEVQNKALCIIADIIGKLDGRTNPPEPRDAENMTQMANLCAENMALIINGLMHINEAL